jgi:general secretion pathway protein L
VDRLEAGAHMSTLRIFLPASERVDADAALRWVLLDRRGDATREGLDRVAAMPRADTVEAILPASRVLFARLKLPRVGEATIRELLPFAVEDRLLADPAQIHAVPGRTDERGDTVVAVVDREWLERATRVLADAGLAPRHAWCESALVTPARGHWHLVLHAQSGVLVDDAGVATTFDWNPTATLPLALRIALDEAAARGERPRAVRVHGAEGSAPDLDAWAAEASTAFEPAAPWSEMQRAPVAPDAIDLLSGELAPRRRGVAALRLSRAALAIAGAMLLLQFAFTAIDTWRLERTRQALESRREAIFRAAFPEAKVVVDPDLQMARNLAQLRAARGLASGDEFLVRLTAAARESSEPVASVDYAQGRLTVRRSAARASR